eukprot:TRINITY_DN26777_c0_g1_i1.p1 TRINITY_DN26777_c0_g1~~TRINITY_DN26777_c0_g1_i1.p1  ORF type:complete len:648 (+),score=129.66 TRINITY_DN26777_c0_g1_i1:39-1982(+)
MTARIIEFRNKGNQATSEGKLEEAEGFYTESVGQWDGDVSSDASVEVVKSYANRAACRLMMKKYKDGRDDALKCLSVQPCHARAMMLYGKLQWEICNAENRPLDTPVWPFVSACSLDDRYLTEVLTTGILSHISEARVKQASLVQNLTEYTPPYTVVHPEGDKRSGRLLKANRDITPGEVVIPFQHPVAMASDKPLDICRRCGKEVTNGLFSCKKCKVTVYCGKECKSKDEDLHKAECEGLNKITKVYAKQLADAKNSFGVTHNQLKEMGYLEVIYGNGEDEVVDVDDLVTTVTLAVSVGMRLAAMKTRNDPNWKNVIELEAHEECVDVSLQLCSRAAVNSAASKITEKIFEDTAIITPLLEAVPFIKTLSDLARTLVCLIQTNSFEVGEGIALVPNPLAYVNHSCLPNCSRNETGVLRASRSIKQGEEITTSYIADLMQNPSRRRAAMRSLQGFTCGCDRCKQNTVLPLADAVKCLSKDCSGGWVSVPEGETRKCSKCGTTTKYTDVSVIVDHLYDEVEKVAPVLHGSIQSLNEVDTELLDKLLALRDRAHETLHPFHWLSHKIHSYLIAPLLLLDHVHDAASHSLYALAAMDATLQAHWVGKADRAEYVSDHYPEGDSMPKFLRTLYTKSVLKDMSDSLKGMGLA